MQQFLYGYRHTMKLFGLTDTWLFLQTSFVIFVQTRLKTHRRLELASFVRKILPSRNFTKKPNTNKQISHGNLSSNWEEKMCLPRCLPFCNSQASAVYLFNNSPSASRSISDSEANAKRSTAECGGPNTDRLSRR